MHPCLFPKLNAGYFSYNLIMAIYVILFDENKVALVKIQQILLHQINLITTYLKRILIILT